MANGFSSCDQSVEEEYIDMDVSSTTFLCCRISSPNNREFEFHLSANPSHIETTISSADELFYKGKLLPLHLSCRLQMVEKPLENSETMYSFKTLASTDTGRETSCYGSCELDPEDYFRICAVKSDKRKSWQKRLRIIRQSLLKAPKAYLKSLFTKTQRSEESNMAYQEGKSNPFMEIQKQEYLSADNNAVVMKRSIDREELADDCSQRKSLSSLLMSHLSSQTSSAASLCSTSSSSFSSKNSSLPQMLKKSSSMNSDMENPILGAIAYCKMSQQVHSRKSV